MALMTVNPPARARKLRPPLPRKSPAIALRRQPPRLRMLLSRPATAMFWWSISFRKPLLDFIIIKKSNYIFTHLQIPSCHFVYATNYITPVFEKQLLYVRATQRLPRHQAYPVYTGSLSSSSTELSSSSSSNSGSYP